MHLRMSKLSPRGCNPIVSNEALLCGRVFAGGAIKSCGFWKTSGNGKMMSLCVSQNWVAVKELPVSF